MKDVIVVILFVIGFIYIIVGLFNKKKKDKNLTAEEENVLSVFKEYGESKDDYTIIESREIDKLPSLEDEERWIKDAESKYNNNNNGLEEDDEEEEEEEEEDDDDEEQWEDENLDRSKSWGVKNRLDWKKNVEVRDFTKTKCCNDENGNMIKPLCKTLYESKLNYKRSEIETMSLELGYSVFDNVGNTVDKEGNCNCSCRWRSIVSN
jgi:hypothetical protein